MRTKIVCGTAALMAILFLCQCGRNTIFNQCQNIENIGWHKNSACVFDVEITDTIAAYRTEIILRNASDYPNQNLWLFVETIAPDSTVATDTINYFLADKFGRWTGTGVGTIFTNTFPLNDSIVFQQKGIYRYKILQAMRYDYLQGITTVGLKINTIQ